MKNILIAFALLTITIAPQQSATGTNYNPSVSAPSGSIGGGALLAGATTTGTATVNGVAAGRPCIAAPSDGTSLASLGVGVNVGCSVTSTGVATVVITAAIAGTPLAKTYTVVAFP